jgi:hypothetical protein
MSTAQGGTSGRRAGDLEVVAHDADDLVPVVGGQLVEAAERARLERGWQRRRPLHDGLCVLLLRAVLLRAGARHGGSR